MTQPLLSVCVPTHHGRAREVGELIASIADQIDPELAGRIEICISDGASRDGTAEVVERAQTDERFILRYRRADPDRGFIAHQHESVELATAPYCWLMSSDDGAAPGAVAGILETLAANRGAIGISMAFEVTDNTLATIVHSPVHERILPPDPTRARTLTTRASVLEELGLIFVSLSAQVVERDAWLVAVRRRMARGPVSALFGHMQVIGLMLDEERPWVWCPDPLLRIRNDNDSWRPGKFGNDWARYWRACLTDISTVYAELCGRWSRNYRSVLARWRGLALGPWSVMNMKMQDSPPPSFGRDLRMLVTFTRLFYTDQGFWRESMPILLLPHNLAPRVWAKRS